MIMEAGEILKYDGHVNRPCCLFCGEKIVTNTAYACGFSGAYANLPQGFIAVHTPCKRTGALPIQRGETRKVIIEDSGNCPFCGGSIEECGLVGQYVDVLARNKVKIDQPCNVFNANLPKKTKAKNPCNCDMFTVLMVKGCQCGGI